MKGGATICFRQGQTVVLSLSFLYVWECTCIYNTKWLHSLVSSLSLSLPSLLLPSLSLSNRLLIPYCSTSCCPHITCTSLSIYCHYFYIISIYLSLSVCLFLIIFFHSHLCILLFFLFLFLYVKIKKFFEIHMYFYFIIKYEI